MVLALQNYFYIFAKKYQPLRCIVCKIGTFPSKTMLCIGNEWKNRSCSTDEDGYHGGESWLLQELTAFFKATRGKSGSSLSRSLVVSHGCFLPMGLGHPLLLGSNRRISVAWIPYGANEGLSGEGKASRRALSGSLEPSWFRLAWAWCRDASHLFPPVSALLQPGVDMEICPKMRPFLWL